MNQTLYDVAFAPMNSRLITLSERLAKPLSKQGNQTFTNILLELLKAQER
jgi:hypothetical protein